MVQDDGYLPCYMVGSYAAVIRVVSVNLDIGWLTRNAQ